MERRRALRVPMCAVGVQITTGDRSTPAAMVDLSLSGARVVASELPGVGARARLQLSLLGRATTIDATVAWRGTRAPCAGLAFDPLGASQRRALADALLLASFRDDDADRAVLLLVDDSPHIAELAAALRARGFAISVLATPLDAIERLTRASPPVRTAIVSSALANGTAGHVLGFLATEHPEVHRVLLTETTDRAGVTIDGRLADRVLVSPWSAYDLDAALDRIGDDPPVALARTPAGGA